MGENKLPFGLPLELQLNIARQVDVVTRLALGSTCRAAAPIVVNTAVFEFRLSKKTSALTLCNEPENQCELKLTHRSSKKAVSTSSPSVRKKGHVMPLYEALDPACEEDSFRCSEHHCEEIGDFYPKEILRDICGIVRLKPGSVVANQWPDSNRYMLPVGMRPEGQCLCLGLSDATLSAIRVLPMGEPHPWSWNPGQPLAQIPRVSCKTSLVVLDLSRAQHVSSLAASGLTSLRMARLPPSARVVALEACTVLSELLPTRGCPQLLSLRLDGCRKLSSASFADGSWALGQLEEFDLGWCACLHAHTLASLLPAASRLRSLSLRGLRVSGVLEALEAGSCLQSLGALDLGFCSELTSPAVQAFTISRPSLLRCNLRAAATISTEVYNATGQLMLTRASPAPQGDVVENRRRPKRLERRVGEPFYYLKRSRR